MGLLHAKEYAMVRGLSMRTHVQRYARFVTLFQPPYSRRWWSHSSTPDWTMATVCSLVSQLSSYGNYSLFLMRQAARLIFHLRRSDHISDAL